MFSDYRAIHSLRVAEAMRRMARESGETEEYQQQMFLLGWLHDVGYSVSDNGGHNEAGYGMLQDGRVLHAGAGYRFKEEIRVHGLPPDSYERNHFADGREREKPFRSNALDYLNAADLSVGPDGACVSPCERLLVCGQKYGKDSVQYRNMLGLCKELKFI